MRLIDGDALKKDLTRFYDNEVTAKELIDAQPTVNGWISVKDKLPEPGMSVIIYGTPIDDPEHTDGKIAITWMSDRNIIDSHRQTTPYWIMPWQCFSMSYKITHWMPLPPRPEEEENEVD